MAEETSKWFGAPPDSEKMKPFLGTWELASDRAVESITFELSGGVVGAKYTVAPSGVEPFQMGVQFIRVLEDKSLQ